MRLTRTQLHGDNGSYTIELAVLAPALILLLGALVLAGRVQTTSSAIDQAARAAARDASLARDANSARAVATQAAQRELAQTACLSIVVQVNTTGFAAPTGQDGTVTTSVACTVSMDDLAIPGLPGARTLTAHASSPLDRYRSR
ncbi:TadE/TadG family type IV pilus assembly protein [Cellulomonas sp. URHD0024]|uniref:TadE/TadG family type IV pilus assembly protein n=1 Tax=Cellulomonas sp. URHD0024 TaxID=1302620 RepID=UPI000484FF18|nr:TadE/TadG family type IV pilus assembly protein [Cellulomonas sp. URHD0024]